MRPVTAAAVGIALLYALCLALGMGSNGCTPPCPSCPRAPTQAERVVCIDEAFGADTAVIKAAVARWDAALCGVVRVSSRVVDPVTEPCALTVLRVDPAWQWVQSRPANAPGWADPSRGLAWVVTPSRDLESIAAHEIGHLLGAGHETLTRHPQGCVSTGARVEAAVNAGRGPAGR